MNKLYIVCAYIFNLAFMSLGIYGFSEELESGFQYLFPSIAAILLIAVPLFSFFILPKIYKAFNFHLIEDEFLLDSEIKSTKGTAIYKVLSLLNILIGLLLLLLSVYGTYKMISDYFLYPAAEFDFDRLVFPAVAFFAGLKIYYYLILYKKIS